MIPLEGIDLREYYSLNFDIRTDSIIGTDWQLKLELKRDNQREVRIVYVSGITGEWLNIQVNLDSFVRPNMVVDDLSRFDDIEQLFITFDSRSGAQGVVYIDNVEFRR